MANENDLIRRGDLKNLLLKRSFFPAIVAAALKEIPKVDAVEVVRCKDCKYLYELSAIDRRFYCRHHPQGLSGINIVEENPFCSYGERKDNV